MALKSAKASASAAPASAIQTSSLARGLLLVLLASNALVAEATYYRRPRFYGGGRSHVTSSYRPYWPRLRATSQVQNRPVIVQVEVCSKQPAGDPLGVCFSQRTNTGSAYLLQCALGTRFNARTCNCDITFQDPRANYQDGYDCGMTKAAKGASSSSSASVASAAAQAVVLSEARAQAALLALAQARAQVQALTQAQASASSVAAVTAQQPTLPVPASSLTSGASSSSSTASASASAGAGTSTGGAGGGGTIILTTTDEDSDSSGTTVRLLRSSDEMAQLLGSPAASSSFPVFADSAAFGSASSGTGLFGEFTRLDDILRGTSSNTPTATSSSASAAAAASASASTGSSGSSLTAGAGVTSGASSTAQAGAEAETIADLTQLLLKTSDTGGSISPTFASSSSAAASSSSASSSSSVPVPFSSGGSGIEQGVAPTTTKTGPY